MEVVAGSAYLSSRCQAEERGKKVLDRKLALTRYKFVTPNLDMMGSTTK